MFRKCLIYLFAYSFLFSMIVELAIGINDGDVPKFTQTLVFLSTECTFLWKLANFTYRRNQILQIEDQLADPQFYGFPNEQMEAVKEKVKSCVFICNVHRGCAAGVITCIMLMPYLDETRHKAPPMPGWLPGNFADYYSLAYGYQIINVCILASLDTTIDILTWIMMTVAAGQFEVLKQNLMNIHYRHGKGRVEEEKMLKKFVQLHLAILRYVAKIEETFTNGIFVQFFASVIVICVTLFQIMFEPFGTARSVALVCYMGCMLCQVAMYCWHGHDLTLTSDAVGRAFYMANWYESDLKIRKTMLIFLERIKRPAVLTGGHFIPLSLGTLTTILRSSYSYVAVLRRIYGGN